ncbi:MAG: hypothetical protein ACRDSH_23570 [Pseudonocardiaceae bacterium]
MRGKPVVHAALLERDDLLDAEFVSNGSHPQFVALAGPAAIRVVEVGIGVDRAFATARCDSAAWMRSGLRASAFSSASTATIASHHLSRCPE